MPEVKEYTVRTSHADLNVKDSTPNAPDADLPTVVLIHGNSFCLKTWEHIFNSPLAETYRIVAYDLPGHGSSSNAFDPERTYNQPAYGDVAVELFKELKIEKVVAVGWSLGGHIAIELIPRFAGLKGILITGTPPVSSGELGKGFMMGDDPASSAYAARDDLTPEEFDDMAHSVCDLPYADWMLECITRTDPAARKLMWGKFDEHLKIFDQRAIMANTTVPVAVVNGTDEIFINIKFVRNVEYSSLWGGKCYEIEGAKHAPHWGQPVMFQTILDTFVKDVSK